MSFRRDCFPSLAMTAGGPSLRGPQRRSNLVPIAAAVFIALLSAAPAQAYRLLVSNEKDNTITVVAGDTLEIVRTVSVGARPRGMALSPDGNKAYLCTSDANHIEILDLATLTVAGTGYQVYVITTHVNMTGSESGTRDQTWWWSPALGMPLQWHEGLSGSRSGASYTAFFR